MASIRYNNIKCEYPCKPITKEELELVSNAIRYNLPEQYLKLLLLSNGATMDYNFSYHDNDLKCNTTSSVGLIYGVNRLEYNKGYDIINNYNDPPEFFPKGIVAFSETGNGDRICFDYRQDFKTDNPPIVYWNHEAIEEDSISFIAKDFESFITMLEEPEKDPNAMSDAEFEKWFKSTR